MKENQESGIILTEKIIKVLKVFPGDEMTFMDSSNNSHTAIISSIAKNYIFH